MKRQATRKIFYLLLLLGTIPLVKAQININEGPNSPPSVNLYASFVNAPASIATGIPDISFPLMSLPTHSKDYNVNIGISYHPTNIKGEEPASDIGSGWSLMYGGVISREFINGMDEANGYGVTNPYINPDNISNDIYYYTLPTGSGKFRINRISDYNFEVTNLSPSNVKIEFTGTRGKYFCIMDSFKITDEKGYQYLFSNYAQSKKGLPWLDTYTYMLVRTAHYLTKILSPSGQEIVTYKNKEFSKSNNAGLIYSYYKPEIIESKDFGSITIVSDFNQFEGPFNDPHSVKSILLKDENGNIIMQYETKYTTLQHYYYDFMENYRKITKRGLKSIIKKDKAGNIIEGTSFGYSGGYGNYGPIPDQYGLYFLYGGDVYGLESPQYLMSGSLQSVLLPSGGKIEYLFGANQIPYEMDVNSPEYISEIENATNLINPEIQYLTKSDSIRLDTKGVTTHTFAVNQPTTLYIKFSIVDYYYGDEGPGHHDPGVSGNTAVPPLKLKIKNLGDIDRDLGPITENSSERVYSIQAKPGTVLELTGFGIADLEFYKVNHVPPPYKNSWPSRDLGIRIEAIKHYDKREEEIPVRTENYNYDLASDPNISAGVTLYDTTDSGFPYVNYKNVKISASDGKGYTRYYYKLYNEFAIELDANTYHYYYPYYNLANNGLLTKKESYNMQNQKVSEETFELVMEELEPEYMLRPGGRIDTRPAYIKEQKITSNIYDASQNMMQSITEIKNSPVNFAVSSQKQKLADGNITESSYQYAKDKGYQNLITSNIVSTAVEVSSKLNGITTSKTTTLFENTGSPFPTTSLSYTGSNTLAGKVTYDHYDSNSNLLQYTDQSGVPTAIIWGYNATQPIAKIQGAKYTDVLSLSGLDMSSDLNTLLDIVQKSNQDISSTDNTNEQLLRDALETFRKKPVFKNYLITTYTYDPLIGVKSMTSPNGFTEYYFYDNANRIQRTEDQDHKVLKEYKYKVNYYPFLQ